MDYKLVTKALKIASNFKTDKANKIDKDYKPDMEVYRTNSDLMTYKADKTDKDHILNIEVYEIDNKLNCSAFVKESSAYNG